jgi:hypothetical protein
VPPTRGAGSSTHIGDVSPALCWYWLVGCKSQMTSSRDVTSRHYFKQLTIFLHDISINTRLLLTFPILVV